VLSFFCLFVLLLLSFHFYVQGARHLSDWVAAYRKLGLVSNWGVGDSIDPVACRTTFNARTYVQPQLQKAVKKAEFFKVTVLEKLDVSLDGHLLNIFPLFLSPLLTDKLIRAM
jgi:hypothetical protein